MGSIESKIRLISRKRLFDKRGWFLKVIDGKEILLPDCTGDIYIVSAEPGEFRGGHYHNKTVEWFTLIVGSAVLILKDIQTGERKEIELHDTYPITVFVPQHIAHKFVNVGDVPFIVVAYTDCFYDPIDSISIELD